jgi:hypothetical protein
MDYRLVNLLAFRKRFENVGCVGRQHDLFNCELRVGKQAN